jgi:hypothetical protein
MLGLVQSPRRGHVRAAARARRPTPITGDHAGFARWPFATQQASSPSADPPKVEEIIAAMRHAADDSHGRRLRGPIVILWRADLRIHEALTLGKRDLDPPRLVARPARQGRTALRCCTSGSGRVGERVARARQE